MSFGIFVINLPEAIGRRERVSGHLAVLGLDAFVIEAVRGSALSASERALAADDSRSVQRYGRALTAGELGCALSHVRAYDKHLCSGHEFGLILEDDAVLLPDVAELLGSAQTHLWMASSQPRLLLMTPIRAFLARDEVPFAVGYRRVRVRRAWEGYGYLVNRAAADAMRRINSPAWLSADDWVAYRRLGGIELCGLDPFCVGYLDTAPSQLEEVAWWQIYGSPLTIPQGDDFMQWSASKPGFTLFSSRNGLLSWSPIVSVSLVGMLALALRRGAGRGLAIGLLLVFAAEAFILGSTRDWWAGWAFGGRRYLGCCVIFGLGLAVVIDRAHGWTTRHSRLVLASLPVGAIGLSVVCNLSLSHDYLFAEVTRGEGQAMRPVYERAELRGVGAVFDTIGNPGAVPANWWFAWRAGVSAQRYDAASRLELTEPTGRPNEQFVVWLDDERIGMRGFGAREEDAGRRASVVAETATFLLPLRRSVQLLARVKQAAVGEGASLRVQVAGVPVLVAEVEPGWRSYDFEVPAELLGPGFNYWRCTRCAASTAASPC